MAPEGPKAAFGSIKPGPAINVSSGMKNVSERRTEALRDKYRYNGER